MPNCQIPSNPDIDGIGIRLALYFQTLIIILILAASPKRALESWWTGIVSAVALQITGFASAATSSLTLYHALLITWLTLPMAAMSVPHTWLYAGAKPPTATIIGQIVGPFLYIAFVMWVWATAPHFGPNPECNHTVKFAFFIAPVNPLGPVRYVILYIVGIWTWLATIAVFFFTGKIVLITLSLASTRAQRYHNWVIARMPRPGPTAPSFNGVVARNAMTLTFCLVLSIVMAELMIHMNDVTPGSGSWTYGQIVAIILLAGPLFTLQRVVREELHHSNATPMSERPLAYYMGRLRHWFRTEKAEEPQIDTGASIVLQEIRVVHATAAPATRAQKRAATF